jgi:hypothetical protein
MKSINIEKLMGHSIGISDSYYRATENELLQDYMNAVDLLTINNDNRILQEQVQKLKEKNKDNEYVVKGKLEERDNDIQLMKEKYEQDMKAMREEMENRFEQILQKIDMRKMVNLQ